MSRQITPLSIVILVIIGFVAGMITMVISNLQRDESPQQAYERGKIDGQALDSTKPYVTMEITSPEIVKQIIGDDTLYFRKIKVDTGYVLKPLYRVHRLWIPEDSVGWWEDWLDTSGGVW